MKRTMEDFLNEALDKSKAQIDKLTTELDLFRRSDEHKDSELKRLRDECASLGQLLMSSKTENAELRKQLEVRKEVRKQNLLQVTQENADLRSQLATSRTAYGKSHQDCLALRKELEAKSARIEELGRTCEAMECPAGRLTVEAAVQQVMRRLDWDYVVDSAAAEVVAEIIRQVQPVADGISVRQLCDLIGDSEESIRFTIDQEETWSIQRVDCEQDDEGVGIALLKTKLRELAKPKPPEMVTIQIPLDTADSMSKYGDGSSDPVVVVRDACRAALKDQQP